MCHPFYAHNRPLSWGMDKGGVFECGISWHLFVFLYILVGLYETEYAKADRWINGSWGCEEYHNEALCQSRHNWYNARLCLLYNLYMWRCICILVDINDEILQILYFNIFFVMLDNLARRRETGHKCMCVQFLDAKIGGWWFWQLLL